jgi:hypothetical protein
MTSRVGMTSRVLGFVLVGVAAWGGIVAYVGPTFDFDMGNTMKPWVWNQSHWTLHLAPGVVGVVGGLLMLAATRRAPEALGAFMALVSGAWFIVGPTLEPLWQHGGPSATIGASGSTTLRVLEGIGYQYGTGAVMVMLSAFALGLLALAPVSSTAAAPDTATTGITPGPRPRLSRHHASHA